MPLWMIKARKRECIEGKDDVSKEDDTEHQDYATEDELTKEKTMH